MLREEERLRRIQLRRLEEILEAGRVVAASIARLAAGEIRQDEIVPLHRLVDDGREVLVKGLLPRLGPVIPDARRHDLLV